LAGEPTNPPDEQMRAVELSTALLSEGTEPEAVELEETAQPFAVSRAFESSRIAPFALLSRATTQILAAELASRAVAFTRRSEVGAPPITDETVSVTST
jgi:hypothetical protein